MSDPVVKVKQGQLSGKVEVTANGTQFYSFQSIPYAKPPLGPLRFKAPQPADPWTGVRDAKKASTPCYNKNIFLNGAVEGDEDCLFLDVFTPEISETKLKPVMFYIHGGGFIAGDNRREMYDPEYLIQHGIVQVNINYRIGALGFLSLEDKSLGVPGNAGLKDQTLALKWVKENIKTFGGDPTNVTIFGESAGSASVNLQILSPMSRGLFHKAIMQSGVATNPWCMSRRCGFDMVAAMGKSAKTEKEVLQILQSASKEEILEVQLKFEDDLNPDHLRYFAPIVEGNNPNEPSFLPEDPLKIIRSGNYNKVPMIIGFNSMEGLMCDVMPEQTSFMKDYLNLLPWDLASPRDSPSKRKELLEKIRKFYVGNADVTDPNSMIPNILFSDLMFVRGICQTIDETLATSNVDLYFYQFSFEGALNMLRIMMPSEKTSKKGACHADDLGYLFKMMMVPTLTKGSKEEIMVRRMTTWWTNFAKYGNPNATNKTEEALLQTNWPKSTKGAIKCFDINENNTVLNDPNRKMIEFWKSLEKLAASL